MATHPIRPAVSGLYAILDWPFAHALEPEVVAAALLQGGARVLQLRAKHASRDERTALARRVAPVCVAAQVPFVLNDDLELALELVDAGVAVAAVHLGQEDLAAVAEPARALGRVRDAGLGLGLSTHTRAQVEALAALPWLPDYIGLGPVFPTRTKAKADPAVGLELLATVRREVAPPQLPIVAIGGIDHARAPLVAQTKVESLAAIGALTADDPDAIRDRTRAMVAAFSP